MTIAFGLLKGIRIPLLPVALSILFAFLSAPRAHAAGVVGTCDQVHLLAAVAGGGNVTFSCSGAINLSSPVPISSSTPTVIDGGGTVTLSGGPGLFFVNCLGSCPLTLHNLTLQNASQSAIYNVGQTVVVYNTAFLNNHAGSGSSFGAGGAIYCDNTSPTNCFFDVHDSYFEGNTSFSGGGAIYNPSLSYLLVTDSTFSLNNADQGGAIYNEGYMVIANSTFTDNGSVTGLGGNIYFAGGFGGPLIKNSTLNAGRAAAGRPGNIFAAGASQGSVALTVVDTIMANPGGASSPGAGNCSGPIIDGGGNLQWPASALPCVGVVADPKLGPLMKNGGSTLTMALLPGSGAIDKGVDATCALEDQRHVLRPQAAHCDIGAFEANTANSTGQSLLQVLGAFLPDLPKNGAGKLTQQAIAPLSQSLDATLWQADGNHLNPQRGEQVFDLHQTIVNNLAELIVDQTQLDYIDNLLLADRMLAAAAMSAANCGAPGAASPSPTNGKCAQAASELAAGDGSAASGNYSQAIDHYKSAWGDATSPSSHD